MRRGFRKRLEQYGDLKKRAVRAKEEENEALLSAVRAVTKDTISTNAEASDTPKSVQKKVQSIQGYKQRRMRELKQELRDLDNPDFEPTQPEGSRRVEMRGDVYVWVKEDGSEQEIQQSDIELDPNWGVQYFLDPETVPRIVRKQYIVDHAKRDIFDALNAQIILEEASKKSNAPGLRETYGRVKYEGESAKERSGFIAEQLVQNILERAVLDLGMEFKVEPADAYQDVTQKVDFVLRRTSRGDRGVGVESDESSPNVIGIQFTINPTEKARRRKREQIKKSKQRLEPEDRIEDILLVQMPMDEVQKIYRQWKDEGEQPGGPEQLLDKKQTEFILRGILDGFLEQSEIDSLIERLEQMVA